MERDTSGSVAAAIPDLNAEGGLLKASNPADLAGAVTPGIHVDRLSRKQLRVWKAIEAVVFAKGPSGRLDHPKLQSLWQWVEQSGNVVYVEMSAPRTPFDRQAGKFLIDKPASDEKKQVAVIRLCLSVIDGALVRDSALCYDDFIRFKDLRKVERYAEVLGHELAHAMWALGEQSHARLLEELNEEIEGFETSRRSALHGAAFTEQEEKRLERIETLMTQTEWPADMAEAEVWKELLESRGKPNRQHLR